jgi:hypothetical protein
MVVERITVLTKTYPELSKEHGPIVCVAGVNEYGEWRRLYPISFKIWFNEKYESIRFRKWDIIEVDVSEKPPTHDRRHESRRVSNWEEIKIIGHVESWEQRMSIISELLDPEIEILAEKNRSLGVIKPYKVEDFYVKPRQRLQSMSDEEVLQKMDQIDSTATLLDYINANDKYLLPEVKEPDAKIEPLPWIGYKFYCSPKCGGHEMMVIDWEAQELFRKYKTVNPVKKKLFYKLVNESDLYFIVGNTWKYYKSFMVIGLFYPPKGTKPLKPLMPIFKRRSTPLFESI